MRRFAEAAVADVLHVNGRFIRLIGEDSRLFKDDGRAMNLIYVAWRMVEWFAKAQGIVEAEDRNACAMMGAPALGGAYPSWCHWDAQPLSLDADVARDACRGEPGRW